MNWIGVIFAVGGMGFAFFRPEMVDPVFGLPVGAWIALIGAGVIDPQILRRK